MDATAHRCFPRDLVRVPGGKCRDVVPKCRGGVAHDEVHYVSLLIALMQTATTLPVFLVGFPAGALADIVDRRRLLSTPGTGGEVKNDAHSELEFVGC